MTDIDDQVIALPQLALRATLRLLCGKSSACCPIGVVEKVVS
jgi:hypothetical protein